MSASVDILLSTYNGENYIKSQIDSLLAQEFLDWRLIIRDDGSNDKTVAIVNDYKSTYFNKITIIESSGGNVGAAQSFSRLMQASNAHYIAFCDQDDIWLPNKLQKQVELMLGVESRLSKHIPILVHSDLRVVDDRLKSLSESFWKYQKLDPKQMKCIQRLLVQNYVTGCASLINRSLLRLAIPIPPNVIMHDWWIALVAKTKGEIINMSDATVLYRQHDRNDTGAKDWGIKYLIEMAGKGPKELKNSMRKTRDQAAELLNSGILTESEEVVVKRYVDMFDLNWIDKRVEMLRCGFAKYGVIRNLIMFLLL